MPSANFERYKTRTSPEETLMDKESWHRTVMSAVADAHEKGTPLAVIYIDVNYFKDINDSLGHETGDRMIGEIRQMLAGILRLRKNRPGGADTVFAADSKVPRLSRIEEDIDIRAGHIGGDEFGVLCKTDDVGARILSGRLRDAFDELLQNPDNADLKELDISLALGVSVLQKGMTASQFLHLADQEMYEDKLNQLAPLTQEQELFLVRLGEELTEHKLRLRDIGKYLILLSRQKKN